MLALILENYLKELSKGCWLPTMYYDYTMKIFKKNIIDASLTPFKTLVSKNVEHYESPVFFILGLENKELF